MSVSKVEVIKKISIKFVPQIYGILLPKLFWPTERKKKCSNDREKLLKFKAEGQEFANFFLKVGQNNFDNKIPFSGGYLEIYLSDWITYVFI